MIIAEMRKAQNLEPRQQALIDHWRVQAIIDGGAMCVGLDQFLTDESKEQFVVSVAKQALHAAETLGRRSGVLINELGTAGGQIMSARLTTLIRPRSIKKR